MATAQTVVPQPDWGQLAEELNVKGPEEAMTLAHDIAAYVARIQKSKNKQLMVKEDGEYFTLKLGSLKHGA